MKSPRNKTIDVSIEEGSKYLAECIKVEKSVDFQQVKNRVIRGDSFSVMPLLPDGFANLLIADPPYNMRKEYHGKTFSKQKDFEYRDFTKKWIEKAIPLLKPDASIYVCCDWKSGLIIGDVLSEYFTIRNRITWQREKGRGSLKNWKNSMEDIWFATNSDDYSFNADAVKIRKKVIAPYRSDGKPKDWEETPHGNFRNTYPSNFWDDISIPYWSMPENTAHPTQKPEKLIAKLILASSNPGDVVFDPFAGSGTCAVTAKKLGRDFVVVEENELYCIWAQKRLERAGTDTDIQGYTEGVFWERNTLSHQKKRKGK